MSGTVHAFFGRKSIAPTLPGPEDEGKKKRDKAKRDRDAPVLVVRVPVKGESARRKRKTSVVVKNAVKAKKMAEDPEFESQGLKVQDDSLWCAACGKHVKFAKRVDVRQHIFGKQGKNVKEIKHAKQVAALQEREKEGAVLATAIARQREVLFEESGGTQVAAGATLSVEVQSMRAYVCGVLMEAGIALSKLKNNKFLRLIEDAHPNLGGFVGVQAMAGIVGETELSKVTAALVGKNASVVFDASKVNFGIEATVARVLDPDFDITHLCIGLSVVSKKITAPSMNLLLRKHLDGVHLPLSHVVGALSDSGPPNPSAMALWNDTAKESLSGNDLMNELLLWVPCVMHAASNCGKVLKKWLPLAKKFLSGFKRMVNTSCTSRELWAEISGAICPSLNEKSFWSWWKCTKRIVDVWYNA